MRMAMTAAGFTGGQADELRRAMGFKRSQERMNDIEIALRAGMAKNGIAGAGAGRDRPGDQVVRALRLPRIARGVVRAARVRVGLPEGVPPGRVHLRAAQQLADGLLSPGDAGQRRRPPRRRGAAHRRHALGLALRRRGRRARAAARPALRLGPARGDRPADRGGAGGGAVRVAGRLRGARAGERARAGDAGRDRRAGGAGRDAAAGAVAGRRDRQVGRAVRATTVVRRRARARAAARDDRRRGDARPTSGGRHLDRPAPGLVRARRPSNARRHRAPPICRTSPTAGASASPAS